MKKSAYVIILFAVIGMALGLYLTKVHIDLVNSDDGTSGCDVIDLGEGFNCDIVQQSPWSTMFGIPIAFLGFLFYLLVALVATGCVFKWKYSDKALAVVHLFTIVSLFYSAYLFYIAKFVLTVFCVFCLMMYVVNIALFISSKVALGKTYKVIITELTTWKS
jgi:uncharacterized membrane protein